MGHIYPIAIAHGSEIVSEEGPERMYKLEIMNDYKSGGISDTAGQLH